MSHTHELLVTLIVATVALAFLVLVGYVARLLAVTGRTNWIWAAVALGSLLTCLPAIITALGTLRG